jgi:hypothetical protein
MQGRSIVPLLKNEKPKDWRTAMYYRYYHYPMHHRVQPHFGVRTERYKLIYFNKIKQWELFDLQTDPHELKNVYADPTYAETVKTLTAELYRLKKEVKDDDQFEKELPKDDVDTQTATRNYRVLGHDKGKVAILDSKGKVEWEYPSRVDGHDIWLLPNGNVLLAAGPATVAEVTRDKKVVWQYEAKPKAGYKGRVEVHAFQRLADGRTMVAESGNRRIVEVDQDGKIVHEVPLTVDRPDAHRDTRMARKLENGHYLVCHEADGKVREYNREGKVVWVYALDLAGRPRSPGHGPEGHGTEVFGAIRLPNGNTMIAGGNNNRVIEVTPKGKVVWSIGHDELPGIRLAWVTTLHRLPNGNLIVGNCHAGPENPQLFEVRRDKKVVWTFKDFKTFGNGLAAAQVLDIEGKVRR